MSLWDQIRSAVPAGVTRALVVSPFFDGSLEFLQRLLDDVRPERLTVAIDPSSVVIPRDASARLPGVRFVNIAGRSLVPTTRRREGASRYMHAKALWFESPQGELLVTGSANASAPAFLLSAGRRNAEAVVIDATPGVGAALGLNAFSDAPEMSSGEWENVEIVEAPGTTKREVRTVLLATPTERGFVLSGPVPEDVVLVAADRESRALGAVVFDARTPAACVLVPSGAAEQTVFLFGDSAMGRIIAVVHRPAEITRHAATDSRNALKQALGALEDDPSQISALLRVTEKVIFDALDGVVSTNPDVMRGRGERDDQLPAR
ncbi:MAG: hypothetical protein IPL79_00045 [Myxococcales bacterium]|nr:hypothetical protein [Myxococcales bacterium]